MNEFNRIALLGFGAMGAGIAQVCARAGCDVVVLETESRFVSAGLARVEDHLQAGVARGKVAPDEAAATIARITGTCEIKDLADAELVIEAIVEDADAKRSLLTAVAAVVSPEAVIVTNTSAIAVTELASAVPVPQRFGGLHFFNPAPLMPLVEVVAAEQTGAATLDRLESFTKYVGKIPVRTKDRPGFLVNRIFMPYINQAIQAFDDGIASRDDIDLAVELGLGYPMGPLRLVDLIGLDVHHHATAAAYEQLPDTHLAPPPILGRMVAAGYLGRKTGQGFYEYPQGDR